MSATKLIPAAAILGVAVGVLFLLASNDPHEFNGTVYADSQPAPGFTLTADDGQRHSLDEYRGKVVLMYFGYTFCPDVCPTSLAQLAAAVAALDSSHRDRVQVVMVTVDPARDTPEVLDEYLGHFNPTFVGFTGTDEEIASVAADYNVFYEAHEGTAATGYLVDHWSGVFLIDGEGNLVESFGYGTPGEMIAADVEEWL